MTYEEIIKVAVATTTKNLKYGDSTYIAIQDGKGYETTKEVAKKLGYDALVKRTLEGRYYTHEIIDVNA